MQPEFLKNLIPSRRLFFIDNSPTGITPETICLSKRILEMKNMTGSKSLKKILVNSLFKLILLTKNLIMVWS